MGPDIPTALPAVTLPVALLAPAVVVLALAWVRSHIWTRGLSRGWQVPAFAGRAGLGFVALMAAAALGQHVLVWATNWPLWPLPLIGAILVETVLAIGRLERQVVSRRAAVALAALRVALVLAVIAMLGQPVLVFDHVRRVQRQVAVLLDLSGSMQVADNNLVPAEKVRLAEALLVSAPKRPCRLDRTAAALRAAGQELQAQNDWLAALADIDPGLRARQLDRTTRAFRKAVKPVRETAVESTNALGTAMGGAFLKKEATLQADLSRLVAQLAGDVVQPLDAALKLTSHWRPSDTNGAAAYGAVRDTVKRVNAVLAETDAKLTVAANAVDEAFYRSLSEADRKAVDRVATLRRVEIARRLLLGRARPAELDRPAEKQKEPDGLLARLDRQYGVRLYTFGADASEMRVGDLPEATDLTNATRIATAQRSANTDIAQALEKVSSDLPPERTAGILLLSDGRHHAAPPVEPIARKLGIQQVPVFPVVLGGNVLPPTDAAVAAVQAPESVSTNDRIAFNLELKLDGLAGTNVTVTLYDGAAPVASNTVTPPGPAFRTEIQLSNVPKTNGLHAYRIAVDTFPSEVNLSNNVSHVPVLVNSDRIKVLLVDGLPRWEYRYLKNLFTERDRNVQLQYLLLHPDQIDGLTNRPQRAASASPGNPEAEATLFPTNETEWMKFDVVLLGDVDPAELGAANMAILKRYVVNRGGTLIVIAGSRHMPHGYDRTPLADLLPVVFKPSNRPILAAPESEFRLALTPEGQNTVFMKLDDDPERNRQTWAAVPGIFWRNGALSAKPGASVLAYATTPEAPVAERAVVVPDAEALLNRQQFERDHALIVSHHAGYGAVLLFGFDQTWRLRHRQGDAYHHKFWGQILRWATADRIASGSATVRIGTTRSRYAVGEPARLQARLAARDFQPIANATLYATLWCGNRKILRRPLLYRPESPGIYTAETGPLPVGDYRVELETAGVRELDAASTLPVSTAFSVTAATDSESVELAADRGLLSRVASLSAGTVLEPTEIESVADRLGPARVSRSERRQVDLWNSWPWLILILALFTTEWMLRKKVRLP
jgi:hypothetical protein